MIKYKQITKKEISLTPMINIIFLLLIFFMLTGTIQMKQVTLINKPTSLHSAEDKFKNKNLLLISVDASGSFYLNNEIITITDLEKKINEQERNRNIYLDLDKNSKVTNLNKIIGILKKYDYKKVYINTIGIDEI
tara:strand:+ start:42 stop:446 length:405 start_codon:yes stop_codon:yes gene_type:complete